MKSFFSLTNLLMVTIVVGCISLLLFSDRGLINLWSLKKEKLEIQNEINDLRNQIAMLEKEEDKLKFDEKYIEKIAREKFKMVKPGERVFKVTDGESN
ncbi:MAG: septum formation initiator family protein [Candidatus Neomarinimicrobiota bacterium]|tara:strand:+ start:469 stop:762 length:294 start_codon:yes stop_codon:yes gene_type:complete